MSDYFAKPDSVKHLFVAWFCYTIVVVDFVRNSKSQWSYIHKLENKVFSLKFMSFLNLNNNRNFMLILKEYEFHYKCKILFQSLTPKIPKWGVIC